MTMTTTMTNNDDDGDDDDDDDGDDEQVSIKSTTLTTPPGFHWFIVYTRTQLAERILSRGESRCPRKLHSNHRERRIVGRRAFREQPPQANKTRGRTGQNDVFGFESFDRIKERRKESFLEGIEKTFFVYFTLCIVVTDRERLDVFLFCSIEFISNWMRHTLYG